MRSWVAELFGMLASSTDNPGSLADWNDLLSMYERVVPMENREEWSKEQGQENDYDNFSQNRSDNSEDNWHVYNYHPDKKQIVFVHSGNTSIEACVGLAEKLKGDYSFAMLDQYNLYHQDDPLQGIPAIATKYIEVLRSHQPCGPYNLGGWCYGGMVAYEMACQLRAMGEEVDMLIMLDAHSVKDEALKQQFINVDDVSLRNYFENSPLFEDLLHRGLLNELVRNSMQVHYDMMQFNPSKYDGEVVYFKAITISSNISEEDKHFFQEMNAKRAGGFEEYIEQQNLHIVDIPQDHDSILNEASLSIIVPIMKKFLK